MVFRSLKKIRNDEAGATAIEYGLIAGLISVVIIGALNAARSSMVGVYEYISSSINAAL